MTISTVFTVASWTTVVFWVEYADGTANYVFNNGTTPAGTYSASFTTPATKTAVALYYYTAASWAFPPYQVDVDYISVVPASSSAFSPPPFAFTGEWWEQDVRLLHLRARWYDPGSAVFLSKDPWPGDGQRPQSLNGWNYVEGNPVNNTDPSGTVTWRQTNREHKAIEILYEGRFGDYQVHREYGQQPGLGTWIDLIYFPAVTQGRFRNNFNFGRTLGEVYEIEPIDKWNDPKGGLDEAKKFIGLLKQNQQKLWGKGKVIDRSFVYDGWDYDWRSVEWDIGNSFDLTGLEVHKVWVPDQNNKMILVWLQRPGLIVYLDPRNDDHKQKLVTDPEFRNIRFRVVAKASNEFQRYREQLRSSAMACYVDLSEDYWNPAYEPPWYTKLFEAFNEIYTNLIKTEQNCAEIGTGCDRFR